MHASPLYRTVRTTFLLVAGASLAALGACSDAPIAGPQAVPSPLLSLGGTVGAPGQGAAEEITRAVAMALSNQGLRNRVRDDLRDSRHTTEHKLELRSYLKGQSGGLLLAQMSRVTGASKDSLLALLAAVRPLELYMPVPAHRESWTGGDNLLVATQLVERENPVAFNLAGERVPMTNDVVPTTPTLGIVGVETDFTKTLDVKKYKNAHDKGGTSIGTFMIVDPCMDPTTPGCEGGTTPPAGVTPDAVYMTQTHLRDAHEPFLKGDPELEIHVHGPINKDYPRYGEDLTCSGADVGAPNYYDQNGNDFSKAIGAGAPLIMSRYDINDFQAKFPAEAVHYVMWEDDNGACKTMIDYNFKTTLLQAAGAGAGAGIVAMKFTTAGAGASIGVGLVASAVAFTIDILKNSASLLYGNDDLVGVLIDIRGTSEQALYPDQTHKVMTGGTFNGTSRLEFVWASQANGRAFASAVTPSTTDVAIDQAQSVYLGATVTDQYGNAMSNPRYWRSANSGVSSIDLNGTLRGAGPGNTTVYVRTCDPNCIDSPVNVAVTGPSLSGPSYAYESDATVSAGVTNARQGSYYYVWEASECSTLSCGGSWYGRGAGWDLTSTTVWVSRYTNSYNVRVTVKTSEYGSIVGTAYWSVNGAGERDETQCDPSYIVCPVNAMSVSPGTLGVKPGARTPKPGTKRIAPR